MVRCKNIFQVESMNALAAIPCKKSRTVVLARSLRIGLTEQAVIAIDENLIFFCILSLKVRPYLCITLFMFIFIRMTIGKTLA